MDKRVQQLIEYYLKISDKPEAQFQLGELYASDAVADYKEALVWYELAAYWGHPGALKRLGDWYYEGKYVSKDIRIAIKSYQQAMEQGRTDVLTRLNYVKEMIEAPLDLEKIQTLKKDCRFDELEEYLLLYEQLQDTEAFYQLGEFYASGPKQDDKKTLAYYEKAAEQGHVEAMVKAYYMYGKVGYTKDERVVQKYFSKVIEQCGTDVDEIFALGMRDYTKGRTKKLSFFREAADRGHAYAQMIVAVDSMPDLEQACEYLERATENGQRGFKYAGMHGLGTEIEKNVRRQCFVLAKQYKMAVAQYQAAWDFEQNKDYKSAAKYYARAAQQNYRDSQVRYELALAEAEKVEEDENLAADSNTPEPQQDPQTMDFDLIKSMEQKKQYLTLFEYVQSFVKKKEDPEALYCLGKYYEEGHGEGLGAIKRERKAMDYYARAAKLGHEGAQYMMGEMYYSAGSMDERSKAAKYYSLAAQQGNLKAQVRLGELYYKGEVVPKDISKAVYYYELAAQKGYHTDKKMMQKMKWLLAEPMDLTKVEALKEANKSKKLVEYLLRYEDGDDGEPMFQLGEYYLSCKDNDKALQYYEKAAQLGHVGGMLQAGCMHSKVTYQKKKAQEYFAKAAAQNDPDGLYNLGVMYMDEWYYQKNRPEALKNFEKAAQTGHEYASLVVASYYGEGNMVKKDMEKAAHYIALAVENGQRGFRNTRMDISRSDWNKDVKPICRQVAEQSDLPAPKYLVGCDLVNEGNYEDALRFFEMPVQQNYHDAREWYDKAVVLHHMKIEQKIAAHMKVAIANLKSAADLGSEEAQKLLKCYEEK